MCGARRVLVVEDSPALRQLLAQALAGEGYAVHTAADGAHALRLLEALAPCLILLDLRMPVMDGRAFARAYRARGDADAPIVVLTAEPAPGPLEDIRPVHVAAKPFDLEALLPVVERWVLAHVPRSS